jgi:hypothetical protein
MKKIYLTIILAIGIISNSHAAGINVGVSLSAGVFEVDGAKEEFKGAHSSGASPGDVTKNASTDGDSAEGLFGIGSIFVEKTVGDRFAIGLDYVPHSLESETAENITNIPTGGSLEVADQATNTVKVEFEDYTTAYLMLKANENVYAKIGYAMVEVATKEVLGTGGAYGDTDLNGYTVALGYNKDLDNGTFLRLEGNYVSLDGATLTNTNDSTKSVTVDGIDGYGAKISIGRSF